MKQPPNYVAQSDFGLVIMSLSLSLYRLKQSPQAWFGKFSHTMKIFGFKLSEANHFVFYYHTSPKKCVYLMLDVDDIIITGNDDTRISQ